MSKELVIDKTEKVLPLVMNLIEFSNEDNSVYYNKASEELENLDYKEDNLTRLMAFVYFAARPRFFEENVYETWYEIYESFSYDPMSVEDMTDAVLDYEPKTLANYLIEGVNLIFDQDHIKEKYPDYKGSETVE